MWKHWRKHGESTASPRSFARTPHSCPSTEIFASLSPAFYAPAPSRIATELIWISPLLLHPSLLCRCSSPPPWRYTFDRANAAAVEYRGQTSKSCLGLRGRIADSIPDRAGNMKRNGGWREYCWFVCTIFCRYRATLRSPFEPDIETITRREFAAPSCRLLLNETSEERNMCRARLERGGSASGER